jgi:hypothetical protein
MFIISEAFSLTAAGWRSILEKAFTSKIQSF